MAKKRDYDVLLKWGIINKKEHKKMLDAKKIREEKKNVGKKISRKR